MALRSLTRLVLARRILGVVEQQVINGPAAVQAVRAAPLAAHRWASTLLQQQKQQQPAAVDPLFPGFGTETDLKWPVLNFKGEQKGEMTLSGAVFNTAVRRDILHRVVRWQLAMRQQGTHKTKTRSEVRGGGRKPRPQKGGGVSRQGSIRAPQWRGGGTTHGPVPRSHAHKLLKRIRRLGLRSALSAKAREGRLIIVDSLRLAQPKTAELSGVLDVLLPEGSRRSVLMSDLAKEGADGGAVLRRASGNLGWVDVVPSLGLNVYSILRRDYLVLTQASVKAVQTRLQTPIRPQFYKAL